MGLLIIMVTTFASFKGENEQLLFYPPILSCVVDGQKTGHFVFFLGIIILVCFPLILLVVCNVLVVLIVLKNINAVYKVYKGKSDDPNQNKLNESVSKERHKKQLHLFRVFGGILVSNLITWLPSMIIILIVFFSDDMVIIPPSVFQLTRIMFFSQVFLHPFLETLLIKEVRDPMKKLMCSCYTDHGNFSIERENGHHENSWCFLSCCSKCRTSSVITKVCIFCNIFHDSLSPSSSSPRTTESHVQYEVSTFNPEDKNVIESPSELTL